MRRLVLASIVALGIAGCASEEPAAVGTSYTVLRLKCECGVTSSFPEWQIPDRCYGCKREFWAIYCPKCNTTMRTTSLGAMCLCGVERAISRCPDCGSVDTHVLKPGPYVCGYRKHPLQLGWCRSCRSFRTRQDGVAPLCTSCGQHLDRKSVV